MGAVLSYEETTKSKERDAQPSAGEKIRKALSTMMDPNSAIKSMKPDTNLQKIYSNASDEQESSLTAEPPIDNSTATTTNYLTDGSVTMTSIPLNDPQQEHEEIILQPATDDENNTKISDEDGEDNENSNKQPGEPVDVYMSLVAPKGLVRMLSSSASSTAATAVSPNNSTHQLSPEDEV